MVVNETRKLAWIVRQWRRANVLRIVLILCEVAVEWEERNI
jgi:hypothetical protein